MSQQGKLTLPKRCVAGVRLLPVLELAHLQWICIHLYSVQQWSLCSTRAELVVPCTGRYQKLCIYVGGGGEKSVFHWFPPAFLAKPCCSSCRPFQGPGSSLLQGMHRWFYLPMAAVPSNHAWGETPLAYVFAAEKCVILLLIICCISLQTATYLSCANCRMALLGILEAPVPELWWNIMCFSSLHGRLQLRECVCLGPSNLVLIFA